ncbi:MAG TPA: hypothetical protein VE172_18405 [Stackebrandtia sp.]|jgi:hypothetical protein|uniref:hypothetical protein n=1 Tax=Stackebrandtia sp. TaxID=2023065 RepID=UPI002D2A480A|nr:hypothetical protein [Stackebrandtia sp.]HZE40778.1 hypothetical protein [Stackebrandtia sp.]
MSDSTPGWAVPGASSAPATHWPAASPAGPSTPRRDPAMRAPYVPPSALREPVIPQRHAIDEALARPTFREPHRSTPGGVFAGAGVTLLWMFVTFFLGGDLRSTLWVMLIAGLFAASGAFVLVRYGDRGAACGVAAVAGTAIAVVGAVVEWHALDGSWLLW